MAMEVEAAGGAGEPALAEAAEQVQADSAEEELGPEAAVEADEDDDSSNTSSSEGEPEWLTQEDEEARSMVFLVTYSALLHKEGYCGGTKLSYTFANHMMKRSEPE
jgi:NADPH-dependent ferric siderophore reductase